MKQLRLTLTIAVLTLLMAACQTPPEIIVYQGTTTTETVEQSLTLEFQQNGTLLTGKYAAGNAKGAFRGSLQDERVTADLIPSSACTYAFEGTLTATTLTGAYQPTACPNGLPGVWDLQRQ